jgi:hypothetical protein
MILHDGVTGVVVALPDYMHPGSLHDLDDDDIDDS